MGEWEQAITCLPASFLGPVGRIPAAFRDTVHEIRLRKGAPVTLSTPLGEWWLKTNGSPVQERETGLLLCGEREIEECFMRLCGHSVYTHQENIRQGFVTSPSGCRAGIGGTAVMEKGECVSIRNISSLCLRIARHHAGCASELARRMSRNGAVPSVLICGEPSSGKTSLLRDLARQLSEGSVGRRLRVAVVDERGELAMDGGLSHCDVLAGCPKPTGLLQAVRCLAPDVALFDELGDDGEISAIRSSLQSGVAVVTTCHGRGISELMRRPVVRELLENGCFTYLISLKGKERPGEIADIIEVGEWIAENTGTGNDRHRRQRGWGLVRRQAWAAGEDAGSDGPVVFTYGG